jgi:large subunit ribosomal protein L2
VFCLKTTALVLGLFRQVTNSVFICLLKFGTGAITFVASAHGVTAGTYIYSNNVKRFDKNKYISSGCRVTVKLLGVKTIFSQIACNREKHIKYVRAAGTYTKTYQRYEDAQIITCCLPTGLKKILLFNNVVTLGRNSNIYHFKRFLSKCGNNLKVGFKSKVRGVAMNPVDHPHGGRTKSSSPEISP